MINLNDTSSLNYTGNQGTFNFQGTHDSIRPSTQINDTNDIIFISFYLVMVNASRFNQTAKVLTSILYNEGITHVKYMLLLAFLISTVQ